MEKRLNAPAAYLIPGMIGEGARLDSSPCNKLIDPLFSDVKKKSIHHMRGTQ
jgi:hypothetical protein